MQGLTGREPKSDRIVLTITPTEHQAVMDAARASGMKMAAFVRRCIQQSPEYNLALLAGKLELELEPTQGDTK